MGRAVMEFTAAREEIERADSLWLKPAPEVKLPDGFFDPNISKTTRRITNISGPARLKILAIIVFIGDSLVKLVKRRLLLQQPLSQAANQ